MNYHDCRIALAFFVVIRVDNNAFQLEAISALRDARVTNAWSFRTLVPHPVCGLCPARLHCCPAGPSPQLFRAMGLIKFCEIAFDAFKNNPSPYYPIPVFGPILLPTLLGNFGGFFSKGFNGHLEKGMPWP